MFEDIVQMEKEIEEFRQNILASSELVKGISELTNAVKKQNEAYSKAMEDASKSADDQIAKIVSEGEHIVSELKIVSTEQQNAFDGKLHQTEEAIAAYQKDAESKYAAFVQRLEATNVDQLFQELDRKSVV